MAVSKKITKVITTHPSSLGDKPTSGGKKVISKEPAKAEEIEETPQASERGDKPTDKKRVCFFCQNGKTPGYTDLATLKRYVNERGKIVPRAKTGVCSKHQRALTRGVKYARHLALLPFTPKV